MEETISQKPRKPIWQIGIFSMAMVVVIFLSVLLIVNGPKTYTINNGNLLEAQAAVEDYLNRDSSGAIEVLKVETEDRYIFILYLDLENEGIWLAGGEQRGINANKYAIIGVGNSNNEIGVFGYEYRDKNSSAADTHRVMLVVFGVITNSQVHAYRITQEQSVDGMTVLCTIAEREATSGIILEIIIELLPVDAGDIQINLYDDKGQLIE